MLNSFKCELCSLSYSSSQNLRKHVRSTHEKQESICNLCKKTFTGNVSIAIHKKTCQATNVGCELCSKTYSSTQNLRRHLRNAYKKGEAICSHCKETFASNESLERHKEFCKLNKYLRMRLLIMRTENFVMYAIEKAGDWSEGQR